MLDKENERFYEFGENVENEREESGLYCEPVPSPTFGKFKHGLKFGSRQFSEENCKRFLAAIFAKVTVQYKRLLAQRKTRNRKLSYPLSNKRFVTSDVLKSSLLGPFAGTSHGAKMFDQSKTLEILIVHVGHMQPENDSDLKYALYGYQAYDKYMYIYWPFTTYEIAQDGESFKINPQKGIQYCNVKNKGSSGDGVREGCVVLQVPQLSFFNEGIVDSEISTIVNVPRRIMSRLVTKYETMGSNAHKNSPKKPKLIKPRKFAIFYQILEKIDSTL
ncbi:hypothetical protein PHYBLDRAFT_172907 [Phycomyces blakesleeanus NRRL 1555(-)]|uniref:Uncharacterized protein n=1 Tax=Phycomyces blakesleeanus (strain ATCC 8743b / DSM 1359 / FGSC 10004 / NBRC 33097 / NRRL 1555) TaxID=763407 RepID=A0A162NFD9_PHYB8|nr:hypothetical protein PHYBLDRAFT_172907 [Phycomyces blakesleeanus NRRL 1555(-)]OAD69074.1 hypothetical protein PHYBLDRAFT_172907 [Phycomyces blakesleeanus NRRL 1555(-)]|eukprot:XP_018287114.1 hypothetical protein PHYBLDRAFT_172907 [Phycomyces blakesleeanus NRRL 1555(-)]